MNYDNSYRKKGWKEGATGVSIDIQMNLLSTWTNHRVAEYYQNIFLAYLDQLDKDAAEEAIKKEIKNTLQSKSLFYCLKRLKYERESLLLQLQSHLTRLSNSQNQQFLPYMCSKVKQVRDVNLNIGETIIKMFQEFHCNYPETQNRQLKEGILLIDDLESSTSLIKKSYLKDYLKMSEHFDPFFMSNYEEIHRQNLQDLKQPIKQLFNLTISYVYRLMKAKNRLLDLRSMVKPPTPKRPSRQITKFQSLPTLQTQYLNEAKIVSQSKRSIATPIRIIPPNSRQKNRRSRTTVHPLFEGRPESSYTELYSKSRPKINRLNDQYEAVQSNRSFKNKIKTNKVYLQTQLNEPQSRRRYQFNRNDEPILEFSKCQPSRRWSKDSSSVRQSVIPITNLTQDAKIQNYNPIKGDHFEVIRSSKSKSKYDFNPQAHRDIRMSQQEQIGISEPGLQWQSPISKYNKKSKYIKHSQNSTPKIQNKSNIKKLDQQIQTVEVRNNKPRPTKTVDEQTVQDQDIIDERPQASEPKRPLIREVKKQAALIKDPLSIKPNKQSNQNNSKVKEDKKQIKMKAGKATIQQILTTLEHAKILSSYKGLFDMQRLVLWIKSSQTYLTEFYINDSCVIIGLCSPIPNVGIALKLWAPLSQSVTESISINLFTKYIQFIEKSTTVDKIMFSGKGEEFKELKSNGFVMKKENLYERLRTKPPKESQSEFRPFLDVECSTVNFSQSGNENMIFSQQIEEFKQSNCDLASFLGSIDKNKIPQNIKNLIKISENLPNFNEVNRILEKEGFDQYEASQLKCTNIKLLRLCLSSPFKPSFLAGQGYLKMVGFLLYQKDEKILISISTAQSNGVLLFAQNMSFQQIRQMSKLVSANKVVFSVKMFSKKLYGKLIKLAPGCYGNFQINLAYEDELQGRIRHNMRIEKCFGPENFKIALFVQKSHLFSISIGEDDFVY